MGENLQVSKEGNIGVIVLDRPKAINALTRQMIDGIASALKDFEDDPAIAAIFLEGTGERGFCAGGDVRAMRALALEGRFDEADAFFAAEYEVDGAIATCSKPVVALTDGIVMGGGIGLAGHARYRIATDRVKFAMPESSIGFFCDCGVNIILARAPRHRALAFMMTGQAVGAADSFTLGLTDCVIPHSKMAEVREKLVVAIALGDVETSIISTMQAEATSGGEAEFVALANDCKSAFAGGSAKEIVTALEMLAKTNESAKKLADMIAQKSPTSLATIVKSHDAVRDHMNLARSLESDRRLASWVVRRPDFSEGVRAILVDKDQVRGWQPKSLDGVDESTIPI